MCENMLSYTKLTDGSFTEFLGALQWELYGKEAHADSTLIYLGSHQNHGFNPSFARIVSICGWYVKGNDNHTKEIQLTESHHREDGFCLMDFMSGPVWGNGWLPQKTINQLCRDRPLTISGPRMRVVCGGGYKCFSFKWHTFSGMLWPSSAFKMMDLSSFIWMTYGLCKHSNICVYIYIYISFHQPGISDIRTFGIVTPSNDHSNDMALRSL